MQFLVITCRLFFSHAPAANPEPTPIPKPLWSVLVSQQPDWLSATWQASLTSSLAIASHQAQGRHIPLLELNTWVSVLECALQQSQQLILFAADLSKMVTKGTMRTYLSTIRHLHISEGHKDPLEGSLQLSLLMVLVGPNWQRGINSFQITPLVLNKVYAVVNQEPQKYENKLLWAACCLGFFAFLRSGEFTIKSGQEFDPTWHLTIKDVAVDSQTDPTRLQIHIKGSKIDQWCQGIHLLVGHFSLTLMVHLLPSSN